MEDEIKIIIKRSKNRKKSIGLEVANVGELIVRAPYNVTNEEINRVLREKDRWIKKALMKSKERVEQQAEVKRYTFDELNVLGDKALEEIPKLCKFYAQVMQVTYGRITIRNQRSRWGSCSSKGNLNFNVLLMDMPEKMRHYVVIHELAHRKYMNHSPFFYKEVEKVMPDYKEAEKWIKEHGECLMAKLP